MIEVPFLKKYQPKYFNDFNIDHDYINLLNLLKNMNNLNILFIGNSESGKTSLIQACIREYYHVDYIPRNNVLFINSLQEQGIQYYRNEVKTFCQTSSSIPNKKKFIILDDIDNINDQSQQVFRNCIDKYSSNVHFIASCSNTQKVIDSIQSRITLIKINPIKSSYLNKIFNNITKKENINITKDAKLLVLQISNNSIRQLTNYLEKFKLIGITITIDEVKKICTNINFHELESYLNACKKNDIKLSNQIIINIYNKGYSVLDILDSLFLYIKITSLLDEEQKFIIIKHICKYIDVFHSIHEHEIELLIFNYKLIQILNSK
tara:strand:- start:1825 stop:2787 length:963 start_codon:yes stop_codon:yes gene_type:complete